MAVSEPMALLKGDNFFFKKASYSHGALPPFFTAGGNWQMSISTCRSLNRYAKTGTLPGPRIRGILSNIDGATRDLEVGPGGVAVVVACGHQLE